MRRTIGVLKVHERLFTAEKRVQTYIDIQSLISDISYKEFLNIRFRHGSIPRSCEIAVGVGGQRSIKGCFCTPCY